MIQRKTTQCALILNAVQALHTHPSADEVYAYVHATKPTISRATVYRDLNRLAEEGKIKRVETTSSATRFDYRLDDHYHFKCLGCGKVIDVNQADVKGLPLISDAKGLTITGFDVVFKGYCLECQHK
ncbi:MAG: transcriptional repressor [Bacilli bacterium]|nr:transcriptional repressor [Bacilli bacterium]